MHERGTFIVACLASCVLVGAAAAVAAPGEERVVRSAPHGRAELLLGGATLAVEYGRPATEGRKIFGGIVPFGRVWRTGADEATKLTTDVDMVFGGLAVPKGSYAIFTVPGESSWQVVLNRVADQWGAFNHDPAQDVGSVPIPVKPLERPVETLTVTLEPTTEREGVLRLAWERTMLTIPFLVAAPVAPPPAAAPAEAPAVAAPAAPRGRAAATRSSGGR